MSSSVRLDGSHFVLQCMALNRFVSLGQQLENRGIVHNVFLTRKPLSNTFFVREKYKLSGYSSYYFLYNVPNILVGVVFVSHSVKTEVSDFRLVIGDCLQELPDKFEPMFTLENCGILGFKGDDGSMLLIPTEIDSSLIVKVD
jgi:hypothetical protein